MLPSLRARCMTNALSSASATTAASGSRPRSYSALARTFRTAPMPGVVAAAVASAAAAIELIEDLRYDYRRLDASAMVAGNVWSAGALLGTPVTEWRALDLARATAR